MKRIFLLIILPLHSAAQFTESFADLNFTSSPEWVGDYQSFVVTEAGELQLYTSGSDTSYLATFQGMVRGTEWQFLVRLPFAPSDNNNTRLYLVSDAMNVTGLVNGYYIRLGETGTDDSIDLYRQSGNNHVKIIDGINGHCAASSNTIRVKVICDESGNWSLFSDISGNSNWLPEGEGTDTTFHQSGWFGIFCKFTSTNSQKFWFDDFYAGEIIHDTISPAVHQARINPGNIVAIRFTESVLPVTATDPTHYFFEASQQPPVSTAYDLPLSTVLLDPGFVLNPDTPYSLMITGIMDYAGNTLKDTILSVSWHENQPFDVVISEIMADPYPPLDLPDTEFIELHNRSGRPITLSSWKLQVGNAVRTIPPVQLDTTAYLLLCSTGSVAALSSYGNTTGVTSFPSLPNAGEYIGILDSAGRVIDSLHYKSNWYQDELKDDGGWTLERINLNNFCSKEDNWKASEDPMGGTPGRMNSVNGDYIDTLPPVLRFYQFTGPDRVELLFSEKIIIREFPATTFTLSDQREITQTDQSEDLLTLTFTPPFLNGTTLSLSVEGLEDICSNKLSAEISLVFYEPFPNEVIITEIMADPSPPVHLPELEYVEIVNTSLYPVNLFGWTFHAGTKKMEISRRWINPGCYLIIAPAGTCSLLGSFIDCEGILGYSDLSNEGKVLSLYDHKGRVQSAVKYTIGWHDPAKSDGGWSLERCDLTNLCDPEGNWQSSIVWAGGTPGLVNGCNHYFPDLSPPEPLRVDWCDSQNLRVVFSETIDTLQLSILNFKVTGHQEPILVNPTEPLYTEVIISYEEAFETGIIHHLTIEGITDCCGNVQTDPVLLPFSKPEAIEPFDIVINEILFNPVDDGADYVEIFNRSLKTLDLDELFLTSVDVMTGNYSTLYRLSDNGFLFFPGDFKVLTPSPDKVQKDFSHHDRYAFIPGGVTIPPMANEQGRIRLLDLSQRTIDDVTYHEDMHFALLSNLKGVSLERMHYDLPSNHISNWHSAAESVGFGTPGLPNSQFMEVRPSAAQLNLSPEIFSPDNDGWEDVLCIAYTMDQPGYIGNITVYDHKGGTVRILMNHELLAATGYVTWDGLTSANHKAPMGIYIVSFDYFMISGKTGCSRKTAVLAAKMND
jgi:hypothetical protein